MGICATRNNSLLPHVYDSRNNTANLPRQIEQWPLNAAHSGPKNDKQRDKFNACLDRIGNNWQWPAQPILFISDTHADAESFLRSLVVGGAIVRDFNQNTFRLSLFGKRAKIILGGDFLDKGPSNLEMLDTLNALRQAGADLVLLAGNHDLRMRVAIDAVMCPRGALSEHLFLRMGRKLLPALREILTRFVHPEALQKQPSEDICKARLLPAHDWPTRFTAAAKDRVPDAAAQREIKKLLAKQAQFDSDVIRKGLSYRALLAAIEKCHELFFTRTGHYAWFFNDMNVIHREASLLFVHAGLCDQMSTLLTHDGADAINRQYRNEMAKDAFACYFGPLANLVRTKYRKSDHSLTRLGVDQLYDAGIHMVIQGHVNNHKGQRLLAKRGLLHLEGDVTLDRKSRHKEGLDGIGAGATIIYPTGDIIGLSRDYPKAKHFAPAQIQPVYLT